MLWRLSEVPYSYHSLDLISIRIQRNLEQMELNAGYQANIRDLPHGAEGQMFEASDTHDDIWELGIATSEAASQDIYYMIEQYKELRTTRIQMIWLRIDNDDDEFWVFLSLPSPQFDQAQRCVPNRRQSSTKRHRPSHRQKGEGQQRFAGNGDQTQLFPPPIKYFTSS